MSKTKSAALETVHTVTGQHPEDIVASLNTASETMRWLHQIFVQIEEKTKRKGDPVALSDIATLAGMGNYLATDFANLFDVQQEDMAAAIKKAGG